jgi:hypothetical protein
MRLRVPLSAAFCPTCSQKAFDADVRRHDFFHEAFEDFAQVDGTIIQTLRLLLTIDNLAKILILSIAAGAGARLLRCVAASEVSGRRLG